MIRYQVQSIPDPDFYPSEPEDEWPEVFVVIDTTSSWKSQIFYCEEYAAIEASDLNLEEHDL
jgi:hypothetical protein